MYRPPYDITPKILKLTSSISEKIGEAKANFLVKPSPQLRKRNKIKTIHSSLKIEGNTKKSFPYGIDVSACTSNLIKTPYVKTIL